MKAAIHESYGPPEIVSVKEIPVPVPKDNEVLIKVHASTVNRTDCGFRSAEYVVSRLFSGIIKPKHQTLGCEFAGEIVSVGNAVKNYKTGDRVFGYNDKTFGGHAQFMVADENSPMAIIPSNYTYEQAAPLTEGSHYALCDIRVMKVNAASDVMIYGATGAIGSSAVQLCKYFGAKVTAVCATPYLELVKSLGADKVIDYTKEDYTNTTEKFDFIFDAVGKSSFGRINKILKPNGSYISTELGAGGENIFLALFTPLMRGKRLRFPIPTVNKQDIEFIRDLAEKGIFKPVIDRTYSLDEIVTAYKYVESGQKIGNVVIRMTDEH